MRRWMKAPIGPRRLSTTTTASRNFCRPSSTVTIRSSPPWVYLHPVAGGLDCVADLRLVKAMGINEYKRQKQRMQIDNSIQSFLDRFYMSRIGIRMLIGQHVALNSMPENDDEYVGIICTRTNVKDLAQEAIENARFVCEDYYGLFDAPKVQLVCRPDLHFMYVPGHLSHMLFETLKNSLRAVVETHGSDSEDFPPIKVIVADGKEVRHEAGTTGTILTRIL